MKILLSVLLVAAIGAGIYYFIRTTNPKNDKIQKDLIIGNWKIDSVYVSSTIDHSISLAEILHRDLDSDSGLFSHNFEFQPAGFILSSLNGRVIDTGHYEWSEKNELRLKEDSSTEILSVLILKKDSLVLQDKDSSLIYFTKKE
jgi:hypothetical protein